MCMDKFTESDSAPVTAKSVVIQRRLGTTQNYGAGYRETGSLVDTSTLTLPNIDFNPPTYVDGNDNAGSNKNKIMNKKLITKKYITDFCTSYKEQVYNADKTLDEVKQNLPYYYQEYPYDGGSPLHGAVLVRDEAQNQAFDELDAKVHQIFGVNLDPARDFEIEVELTHALVKDGYKVEGQPFTTLVLLDREERMVAIVDGEYGSRKYTVSMTTSTMHWNHHFTNKIEDAVNANNCLTGII